MAAIVQQMSWGTDPDKVPSTPITEVKEALIGDGDEIVALESFADRLLVFKRQIMYIINISGDIEFIEQEHKFIGINNPYSVTRTDLGVIWVNKQGAYIYNGENVTRLLEKKGSA